jgi:porin
VLTLDAPTDEPSFSPSAPFGVTGDWGGARTALARRGLSLAGVVLLDISQNFHGGLDTGSTPVHCLLSLNATLETEPLLHWPGGTAYLEFLSHDGPAASATLTGDTMGFDNADALSFVQFYQLWYQQLLLDDKLRVKIGKMDANNDFSVAEHSREFLNSTMAYSIAMFTLPTYPDAAPGAALFFNVTDTFYVGGGVFYSNRSDTFLDIAGSPSQSRGSAGGMFGIGEVGYHWKFADLPGHAGVGGWTHTGTFAAVNGGPQVYKGTSGYYGFADQTLWVNESGQGPREAGLFANFGSANENVSAVANQAAAGITAIGLFPTRPADVTGLGAAWIGLGNLPATPHSAEWSIEVFHKCVLTPWASIKTDLQYIHEPSGSLPDALVGTVRVQVDF